MIQQLIKEPHLTQRSCSRSFPTSLHCGTFSTIRACFFTSIASTHTHCKQLLCLSCEQKLVPKFASKFTNQFFSVLFPSAFNMERPRRRRQRCTSCVRRVTQIAGARVWWRCRDVVLHGNNFSSRHVHSRCGRDRTGK